MQTTLTIIKYKTRMVPFAFLSMALFRVPLLLNKKISFFKLMGSGKNGTFDKQPDLNQWAIFAVHTQTLEFKNTEDYIKNFYGKFIAFWLRLFSCEHLTLVMEPLSGHGFWDQQTIYQHYKNQETNAGPIATLTRATIRMSKLKHFWKNVAPVAQNMKTAKGFIYSIGIGEVPWIKQATFSIWESLDDMKAFAYQMKEHSEVIKKTRKEKWYSEDMFVRFSITNSIGTINGLNPLQRKQ